MLFGQLIGTVSVRTLSRVVPNPDFPLEEVLIERHPDFVLPTAKLCNYKIGKLQLCGI